MHGTAVWREKLRLSLGRQTGKKLSGNFARIQIRRKLDDLLQQLFGFTAIVGGKFSAGHPQGKGDLVQLLSVILDQILQHFDVGLAGGQESQALLVEFGIEDHALLHRFAFLHGFQLLLEKEQLIHVLLGVFKVVLLLGAVAQIADNGKAGEKLLFFVLAGLDGEGGEQRDGIIEAALSAIGVGEMQANRERNVLVFHRNLKLGFVLTQETFYIQVIVEPGEQLAVHIVCSQTLGEDDNGQADQREQNHGNEIGSAIQCDIHADQREVAGADEIHSVFALGKEMNHDGNSLRKNQCI